MEMEVGIKEFLSQLDLHLGMEYLRPFNDHPYLFFCLSKIGAENTGNMYTKLKNTQFS